MILTLALLLTGCAGRQGSDKGAQQLRSHYQDMPAIQAQAEVSADYGDRAYQYTVTVQGSEEEGSLTVTAPESIAGTGTAWKDGQTVLDYDGISLETGQLSPDGLSPADAMPVILAACRSGAVAESGWTDWGEGERCLYLLTQNPKSPEKDSTVALWVDPDTGRLLYAEILWQGKRVISFTFTDFVLQ
jgi:outer membrane lipoprotein-sorting protein